MVNYNENPPARIAVIGLMLASTFTFLKMRGAIILAIFIATFIGINYANTPCNSLELNNSCVTNLSIWNKDNKLLHFVVDVTDITAGKLTFKYITSGIFWEAVFTFLFVELFDSFGTLTGVVTTAGFTDGDLKADMTKVNRAMLIDGFGLSLGAIMGSNSITCFVESYTGIEAGARTGIASMVTGSCFLLSLLFVFPFVAIIPDAATTCSLVMVGVSLLVNLKDINFNDPVDLFTAFMTIACMGYTYSVSSTISYHLIYFIILLYMSYRLQMASVLDLSSSLGFEE
jgi:AGZA family xanthine/uracil permease-like MFS transporter